VTNNAYATNNVINSNTATQIVTEAAITVLQLTKTASSITYTASGQTITYTYTVTNTGTIDLDAPINVTDDKFGTISIQSSGILSPGSSVTGTATYTITQQDINTGSVTNSAYAIGSLSTNQLFRPRLLQ